MAITEKDLIRKFGLAQEEISQELLDALEEQNKAVREAKAMSRSLFETKEKIRDTVRSKKRKVASPQSPFSFADTVTGGASLLGQGALHLGGVLTENPLLNMAASRLGSRRQRIKSAKEQSYGEVRSRIEEARKKREDEAKSPEAKANESLESETIEAINVGNEEIIPRLEAIGENTDNTVSILKQIAQSDKKQLMFQQDQAKDAELEASSEIPKPTVVEAESQNEKKKAKKSKFGFDPIGMIMPMITSTIMPMIMGAGALMTPLVIGAAKAAAIAAVGALAFKVGEKLNTVLQDFGILASKEDHQEDLKQREIGAERASTQIVQVKRETVETRGASPDVPETAGSSKALTYGERLEELQRENTFFKEKIEEVQSRTAMTGEGLSQAEIGELDQYLRAVESNKKEIEKIEEKTGVPIVTSLKGLFTGESEKEKKLNQLPEGVDVQEANQKRLLLNRQLIEQGKEPEYPLFDRTGKKMSMEETLEVMSGNNFKSAEILDNTPQQEIQQTERERAKKQLEVEQISKSNVSQNAKNILGGYNESPTALLGMQEAVDKQEYRRLAELAATANNKAQPVTAPPNPGTTQTGHSGGMTAIITGDGSTSLAAKEKQYGS